MLWVLYLCLSINLWRIFLTNNTFLNSIYKVINFHSTTHQKPTLFLRDSLQYWSKTTLKSHPTSLHQEAYSTATQKETFILQVLFKCFSQRAQQKPLNCTTTRHVPFLSSCRHVSIPNPICKLSRFRHTNNNSYMISWVILFTLKIQKGDTI